MCSLLLLHPPSSLVFFLFRCVSCEWESVCIHEDQLEGIPISTAGFFPSLVLFSAEGTVLFRLIKRASSVPLCVWEYLFGLHGGIDRTLNKCHPVFRSTQLHHFSPIFLVLNKKTKQKTGVFCMSEISPELTPLCLTDGFI